MSRLKIEYGPPTRLVANDYNVNVVSPENQAKIDASVSRFGFFKPILCRELPDGRLEIIGGEHRWQAAQRLGIAEVPFINLGPLSDAKAKEIGIVDNGRYGADDTLRMAELLESIGLDADELASFMPYSESDFNAIFSSVTIELDELDLDEDEAKKPESPREKPAQTAQVLRFKVGLEDADWISKLVTRTMKTQGFKEADELTNAGDALVHLLRGIKDAA
jgi:ParB-like chromosome segregation protein Spo0J